MKKEGIKRGIAVLLTVGVLITLLLAGPAEAVILSLNSDKGEVDQGESITFIAKADVVSADRMGSYDYFILKLTGPQTTECKFDVNGNPISGCDGITIQKISSPPQNGYGYYDDGKFEFNITLDTSAYQLGTYDTYLKTVINGAPTEKQGDTIKIKSTPPLGGCSIRAKDGTATVGNDEFKRPTLNFHIPLENAGKGKGTFSGQVDRSRISYSFNIISVENHANYAKIKVKGNLEVNGSNKGVKEAVITYDKISKEIDLTSAEISLDARDMKITFQKRC